MINFDGIDIVARDHIDDVALVRALASVLRVTPERVAVIADVGEYPSADVADVVCVRSTAGGSFSDVLSIQVAITQVAYDNELQLVQVICDALDTDLLVPSDDDVDPYVMHLISPQRPCRKVTLDPAQLDEGRYAITQGAATPAR